MAEFQTVTGVHDSSNVGIDDTEHTEFQKGDRVFVLLSNDNSIPTLTTAAPAAAVGLKESIGHYRHGHIIAVGSQSCAIHFDAGNGIGKFQTVLISPNRIKREQPSIPECHIPLSCTVQNRATVVDGALVHGSPIHDGIHSTTATYNAAAMMGVMQLIRWIAATSCSNTVVPSKQMMYKNLSWEQSQQLSNDDCYALNEIAIQNWERRIESNDENSTRNGGDGDSGGDGVYDRLVQYVMNKQNIRSGWIVDALLEIRAVRSWHRCIQFNFWFVGKDDTGTYVIPDCRSHEHVVYKVVGFGGRGPSSSSSSSQAMSGSDTVRAPVRLIRIPMCLRITILPWYGRLLHDTSVPQLKETIRMATDLSIASRLHNVTLHAIHNGTVIEHFAELEKHTGTGIYINK